MQLARVFERRAFEEGAFEEQEMASEKKGQASREVGRTEEMVETAKEGMTNFLVELVVALQGMALEGKAWALEIERVRMVEGRAWEAIGKLLEGQERDEG